MIEVGVETMSIIPTVVEGYAVVVVASMEDRTWVEMMTGDETEVSAVTGTWTTSGIVVEVATAAMATVTMAVERGILGTATKEERGLSEMVAPPFVLQVLPMGARVPATMITLAPVKLLPHLPTPTLVSRDPSLLPRRYLMTADLRCQRHRPKMVILGDSRRICIGGMVGLMEGVTISSGKSFMY
jgi:hypothetical protein